MHIPDKSIILIQSGESEPNWQRPWVKRDIQHGSGTGFVIEYENKKYIATNEHIVRFSSYVHLFKRGSSVPYKGKIVLIVPECDVAILDCDDERFWTGLEPLALGGLPARTTKVYVFGYPIDSTNISATRGIVSRHLIKEYTRYTKGLYIQIDAAINPGNSGGPVLNDQSIVVGMVKASAMNTEGMALIIPTLFIKYCLALLPTGFKGFSQLPINLQMFQNSTMHEFYGINSGSLVVHSDDPKINAGDVIISINNKHINNDMTISLSDALDLLSEQNDHSASDEVIDFRMPLSLLPESAEIEIELFRKNKTIKIKTNLISNKPAPELFPTYPQWLIIMGMVFTNNSKPLADTANELGLYSTNIPAIVMSDVMLSEYVIDFPPAMSVLVAINGQLIKTLQDIVKALGKKSKFYVFQFMNTPKLAIIKASDLVNNDEVNASLM